MFFPTECSYGIILSKNSGFLIGPHIVLIAAHNVYDNEKPLRKRYSDIKCILGTNGVEIPFGEIEDIVMRLHQKVTSIPRGKTKRMV